MIVEFTGTHIELTNESQTELDALCRAFRLDSGLLPTARTPENVTARPYYDREILVVKIAHLETP